MKYSAKTLLLAFWRTIDGYEAIHMIRKGKRAGVRARNRKTPSRYARKPAPLVHQVRDWFSGAAAYFGWMREAKRENTRCGVRRRKLCERRCIRSGESKRLSSSRGLSTAYGHEFTNRSERMYSESQSRKAERLNLNSSRSGRASRGS